VVASSLLAAPALSQQLREPGPGRAPGTIGLKMLVAHLSASPGEIDPRAAGLYRQLQKDFRYESVRVLEQRRLDLLVDQVGTMRLPTGRDMYVRPIDVGETGVLVRVEVQGAIKSRLRVPNHEMVVIGGLPYEGGRLVISLEPDY
jgi:hypothetical protein